MKIIQLVLLVLASILAELALAKPIWCPGGSDRDIDHPLSRETLSHNDITGLQFVDKLALVSDAFEKDVNRIERETGFQSTDERDLAIFRQAMVEVKNTFQVERVIESVRFRATRLQSDGLTKVTCFPLQGAVDTPSPVLKSIYYAAYTAYSFAAEFQSDVQGVTAVAIAKRSEEYETWILSEQSLAQWPWEMYVNEKFVSNDHNSPAPLTQIIAMRPSAGLNLSFASQEDADAVPAFALEPIGFIRYSNHEYKKHMGVSLLLTLGSEDGAGYGLVFRWNGYWAGYTFHSGDAADAVYVGVDLHNYLKSEASKTREQNEFAARLRNALY